MKKPYINPAFYGLSSLVISAFAGYLLSEPHTINLLQKIIYVTSMCLITLYFCYVLLKPFHPVVLKNNQIIIKRFYAKNIKIQLSDIQSITIVNRFDILRIQTNHKTYRIPFLLQTEDFIHHINKNMSSKR